MFTVDGDYFDFFLFCAFHNKLAACNKCFLVSECYLVPGFDCGECRLKPCHADDGVDKHTAALGSKLA
jgi:hypothetical protein